jgi:hypothetical protein
MVVLPEFETRDVMNRKPVETSFRNFHVEDGELPRLKAFRLHGLRPQQHLSLGNHNRRELWNDTRRPWSCGHDQGACFVSIDVGDHPHAVREHVPPAYTLAPVNVGSKRQGSVEVRGTASDIKKPPSGW